MSQPTKEIVLEGTWLYDNSVQKPVYIVRANYDFYYELGKADDQLEPGEKPNLNEEGVLYYVSFSGFRSDGSFWPDSSGHHTIEDAQAAAESKVPSEIKWQSA